MQEVPGLCECYIPQVQILINSVDVNRFPPQARRVQINESLTQLAIHADAVFCALAEV